MAERLDRRGFLRLGGAAALAATALGTGCSEGSERSKAGSTAQSSSRTRTLRIVQWSHFVPTYDAWFDDEYTKRWGQEHDIEVIVDHVPLVEVPGRADAEVATQRGHDIFGAVDYREAFARSESYNIPAFPGAVKDLSTLLASDATAQPPDKYAFLAEAGQWSTNLGHPGHTNAVTNDVLNQFLIPRMFAAAARGEGAEEAVKTAEAQIKPIFDKWRERGKV